MDTEGVCKRQMEKWKEERKKIRLGGDGDEGDYTPVSSWLLTALDETLDIVEFWIQL